ncbi:MAG: 16S rRNA (cytosine(967)-C(5))-methyltransferase RsmB [Cardiobacteriaceae bacterium]|nr:16S rRNA (cytosine(967)-C(5))-methyltransferase RsmB [Cardiobacteriaceae bacterium]
MKARQAAFHTLDGVINHRRTLNTLLTQYKNHVVPPDQALYQALVYGTLRQYRALLALSAAMMRKPPATAGHPLSIIINLGLYQLLAMNLGDHGVINETVNLAAHNKQIRAKGLINAILRRVQRERSAWQMRLKQADELNLPEWLRGRYPEQQAGIAAVNSSPPPLTLRLAHTHDRTAWLNAHGNARANPLHAQAITLHSGSNVQHIPGFLGGDISVQDAAAQQAATLLHPQNGERLLDACAAPGGKTGHILELAPECHLLALDQDEERLVRVQENLARLHLHAELCVADAANPAAWWDGKPFDAILLDAPCSGSGVLRRHPDIGWLRSDEDLQNLAAQQQHLLDKLWPTLKQEGRLLYTTCSILEEENQHNIAAFLAAHPDAYLQPLTLPACIDTGYGSLHLPDDDGDGFYYAMLHKK